MTATDYSTTSVEWSVKAHWNQTYKVVIVSVPISPKDILVCYEISGIFAKWSLSTDTGSRSGVNRPWINSFW